MDETYTVCGIRSTASTTSIASRFADVPKLQSASALSSARRRTKMSQPVDDTDGQPEPMLEEVPADGGIDKALVMQLLSENATPVPREQLQMPSRMVLWHAYDATHAPGCALQEIKYGTKFSGAIMSKTLRMAACLELYRKLTGDQSTPSKLLSAEADAIAKKRQAGHNTPSASMRRWLFEIPLACSQQGPWCEVHRTWKHVCHCPTVADPLPRSSSPRAASPAPQRPVLGMRSPSPAPRRAPEDPSFSPGPGAYHTSGHFDMAKNIQLSSRPSPAFAGPTAREMPRGSSPGREPRSARAALNHTPPPGVQDLTQLESIARHTQFKGQGTAAFSSRTGIAMGAHQDRIVRQEDHGTLHGSAPGPGAYEPERSFQTSIKSHAISHAVSSHFGQSGFLSTSKRESGVLEPKWLSGPLKGRFLPLVDDVPFSQHAQRSSSPPRSQMGFGFEESDAAAAAAAARNAERVLEAKQAYAALERSASRGSRASSAPHSRPPPEPFGISEETRREAHRQMGDHARARQQAQARYNARAAAERDRQEQLDRENEARLRDAEARAAAAMADLARVHEELNKAARAGASPASPFMRAPVWSPSVARAQSPGASTARSPFASRAILS